MNTYGPLEDVDQVRRLQKKLISARIFIPFIRWPTWSLLGLCSSSSAVIALAAADKEFVAKHIGAQQALLDALGLTYEDGAKLFEAFEAMDASGAGSGNVDFHEFCVVSTHPHALDCALDCCSVTTRASSSVTSLRHSPHFNPTHSPLRSTRRPLT